MTVFVGLTSDAGSRLNADALHDDVHAVFYASSSKSTKSVTAME
jgi:hypothetical protein